MDQKKVQYGSFRMMMIKWHATNGVRAMLILTRRIGEVLMIGDEIKITVLGVRGHQVRIGVDAPKNISVHRKEIYDQVSQTSEKNDKELDGINLETKDE